jgi:hypothetical protein
MRLVARDTRLVVFTGPSLRPGDLEMLRAAAAAAGRSMELRRPVRRLDLLELAPGCDVLMLDGEFGQSLAVSITEIRAVLATGQPLAGASSMGALRAVECRPLGMTGSGWVFEQYLTGAIESDGDVALLYDPDDYQPVTIPLVNVRWLLAVHELPAADAAAALEVAHSLHFRSRRPTVLARAWQRRLPAAVADVLVPELADERRDTWDRKRLDAIAAVRGALDLEAA